MEGAFDEIIGLPFVRQLVTAEIGDRGVWRDECGTLIISVQLEFA